MSIATVGLVLCALSGLAWTIVYASLIYTGFKQKTYGMPFAALALNIAWEGLYSYYGLVEQPDNIQTIVNIVWILCDVIILYTYFKYGTKDFSKFANPKYFVPWSVLILVMSFVLQYYFSIEFGETISPNLSQVRTFVDPNLGCWYSAFIQNLVMSLLFILLLTIRRSSEGQNQTIAVAKLVGTLAPTILFGVILENRLVLALGIFVGIFDLIYIWLLQSYKKENK